MTIGDYLAAIAGRGPRPEQDRVASGPRLTYAELALDVERVACGLLALGIEKGDRIADLGAATPPSGRSSSSPPPGPAPCS